MATPSFHISFNETNHTRYNRNITMYGCVISFGDNLRFEIQDIQNADTYSPLTLSYDVSDGYEYCFELKAQEGFLTIETRLHMMKVTTLLPITKKQKSAFCYVLDMLEAKKLASKT